MTISEDQIARGAEALTQQLKAGAPIDYVKHEGGDDYTFDGRLNVLDLAQAVLLAAQQPVTFPSRDDLAFELYATDNGNAPRERSALEWTQLIAEFNAGEGQAPYTFPLADAAIEQFRKANR